MLLPHFRGGEQPCQYPAESIPLRALQAEHAAVVITVLALVPNLEPAANAGGVNRRAASPRFCRRADLGRLDNDLGRVRLGRLVLRLQDRGPGLDQRRAGRRQQAIDGDGPVERFQGFKDSAHGFQSTPEKQAIKGKRRRGSALRSLRHT